MATTPKLALRYPINTDHARLWEHLRNLATDVDNKLAHRALPYFGKPYIESGGAITNPLGLNINVASGLACINGVTFDFIASGNLLLPANATSRVWLVATFDANGYITGYTWSIRTDAVVPANSVMLGEVITGAAAPTLTQHTFRGVIQPGRLIQRVTSGPSAAYAANAQIGSTLDFCHDGLTPVEVRMESPRFYSNAAIDFGGYIRNFTSAVNYQAWRKYFAAGTQLDSVVINTVAAEIGILIGRNLIGLSTIGSGATIMAFEKMDLTARFDF